MDSVNKKIWLIAAGLFVLMLLLGFWWTRPRPLPRKEEAAAAHALIESSGVIFGLTIGSDMAKARTILDPLRLQAGHVPDAKEESGRRIYWKLRETEFDWIMAWANSEGKITRLRAVFRPDKSRPFAEIGDLSAAIAVTDSSVKWDLRAPQGPPYRLVAQGAGRQAKTIYMFSVELPGEGEHAAETEEEEGD